ncbi:hypothetical protein [Xanthobacter sp. 91]|uniref:hypothetical protein n=1 Tax=Xanthobacter sp. 91 TaxID=1117244 RepID=UPI00068B676A|nr:hypothetical protein [Xanthobacter sp. 91]
MVDNRTAGGAPTDASAGRDFWLREGPYLAILALTVGGVAYVAMTRRPLVTFWEFVAVASCAVGIFAGWRRAALKEQRLRLVVTQLLHWGAFLAAMNLVFLPSVQAVADADSTSLIVLLLLALGSFVAGVHTQSWRMGLNGVFMALCVPAVAWLDQSALFVALVGAAAVGAAGFILWARLRI